MAGKKLKDTYEERYLWRVVEMHEKFGDKLKELINNGYTPNDLFKAGYGVSDRMVHYYIDKYGFRDITIINIRNKRAQTARVNGRGAIKALKGILLKPDTDEIVNWHKQQVADGKFRMGIMYELREKFGYCRRKYDKFAELYGKGALNPQSGELNPFYGHTPDKQSGRGIKTHILVEGKYIFCRSLLELEVYLYLKIKGIRFELSKHQIKYISDTGVSRTYNPDIVFIDTDIVSEIKPISLVATTLNKLKFEAAMKYCSKNNLKFDIITEKTYPLGEITFDYIQKCIDNGDIIINEDNYKRLLNNKDEYNNTNSNIRSSTTTE